MAKIKSFFQKNKYMLSSAGLSLFIILIVYFCYEIGPFGEKIIYRMDLYHQYGPLFSELYDRLTSSQSMFYSWNTGLGSSFLGNFFNYLSSPFSFLILLFGHKNTFEAVAAIIAIKGVLSSLSMTNYLIKSRKGDSFAVSAFGVLYAFCGYFIAFYWNVMWIDAMYLLPFVALGIERIINNGKGKTYMFSLLLSIVTNYYIGFMLCVFSCIYFLYYYACHKYEIDKKRALLDTKGFWNKIKNSVFLHSGIKFALISLAVVIILMPVLFPVANILNESSATTGTAPTEVNYYFKIFDFIANHLASLEPTIRSSGEDVLPNIYCGMLTVLLLPLFFFSKKIRLSEKLASIILLVFMYFSFCLNYLNFFWHGLHFPNDLPYRQSFMYSFILIILAYRALENIKEFDKNQLIAIGMGIIAFIVIAQKVGSKNVTDSTVFVSVAFVIAYVIILGLMISKKAQVTALSILLLCTCASESIIASTGHYVANQSKESFASDYDDFKSAQNKIKSADKSLFYREELSNLRARMDPSWYGYNGISIFSSMAYEKVANLQKAVGLYGNKINSFTYNPQTPVYNSMFSLKYVYDKDSKVSEGRYYRNALTEGRFTVYENMFPLSIAYPVSDKVLDWEAVTYANPVTAQEEYFYLATGVEGVYNRIYDYEIMCSNVLSVSEEEKQEEVLTLNRISDEYDAAATVEITAESDENIYIYVNCRKLDTVEVYSPKITTTMSVLDGYILDLGRHDTGDVISVELPLKDNEKTASVDFTAFTVDYDKFKEGYEKLKNGELELTRFSDTVVKGVITAEENEILYTSIPYDNGWTVYIDGKKAPKDSVVKISEALTGVEVSAGEHTITFIYSVKYLRESTIISAVFVTVLLIFWVLKTRKWLFFKKSKPNIWQRLEKAEAEESLNTLATDNDSEIEIQLMNDNLISEIDNNSIDNSDNTNE